MTEFAEALTEGAGIAGWIAECHPLGAGCGHRAFDYIPNWLRDVTGLIEQDKHMLFVGSGERL